MDLPFLLVFVWDSWNTSSPLATVPWQFPAQVSPVSEQVVVIVAADSPTPTAPGPVDTGGVNGAAVDHRAGHPGWRRKSSGDTGPALLYPHP